VFVGVGRLQELTHESTYLETDLNTGQCRDIAVVKPQTSLSSSAGDLSQQPTTVSRQSDTASSAHSVISSAPGSQGHAGSFPQKSPAYGHPGYSGGNSHAGGYTTSAIGGYSGVRNPGITGPGFPSEDAGKVSSSSSERAEPRSGVYSLASSRPSVQQTSSQPGTLVSAYCTPLACPELDARLSVSSDKQSCPENLENLAKLKTKTFNHWP